MNVNVGGTYTLGSTITPSVARSKVLYVQRDAPVWRS
jgi:hypothetical protein